MIEPLQLTFEVAASPDHAFAIWTDGIDRWWPGDHTVTEEDGVTVVLEGRVGGRIYERTTDGREFDWGEVTVWEPPTRLAYLWHLRRDRADATEVEIQFRETAPNATRVEIEHRGWERLGVDGQTWRDRNAGGWATLLPHYHTRLSWPPTGWRRRHDRTGQWHPRGPVAAQDPARYLRLPDVARRGGEPADAGLPGRFDAAEVRPAGDRRPARDAQGARRLDAARGGR